MWKMAKCKKARRYLPALVAWFLLLSITSLFYIFPAHWYYRQHSIWILIGEGVLTLIVVAMFSLATFMDPGIIPKAPPGEDANDDLTAPLYITADVRGISVRMKWCITCQFYRPPRCSHCSICDHCIETFDHHCPWVNNCIGRRNYRYFFGFLISLSLHMMFVFSLCLIYLLNHSDRISHMSDYRVFVTIFIMVLDAILWFPVFGLAVFHVVLVSRGRTTNEQVTGKYAGGFNPYSKGCLSNCYFTLCFQPYPLLLKPKNKKDLSLVYDPSSPSHGAVEQSKSSKNYGQNPMPHGNQVKVYMGGNRNSVKSRNTTHLSRDSNYRPMMPHREPDPHDLELGLQSSQSLDCEPPPAETSFLMMPKNHFPHGSPHPNRHTKDSSVSSMEVSVQQRMRAIGGIPTPFTPPNPTTSPKHFGNSKLIHANTDPRLNPSLYTDSQLYPDSRDPSVRILQLASSPQRGSYQWADMTPHEFHHSISNRQQGPSHIQQIPTNQHKFYTPQTQSQGQRSGSHGGGQQRPVDFVRALELSEGDHYKESSNERQRRFHNRGPAPGTSPADNRDLNSVYDMNYEISV